MGIDFISLTRLGSRNRPSSHKSNSEDIPSWLRGLISEEEEQEGATQVWLPAGEIFVTPVDGTANGQVVIDEYWYQGTRVEGLTLTFQNGNLTSMEATSGLEAVEAAYDQAAAGKERFGVIDIGLNSDLSIPEGSSFRSWVIEGMLTVGFGGNLWAGGSNSIGFAINGHIVGATVSVDGEPILQDGRIVL